MQDALGKHRCVDAVPEGQLLQRLTEIPRLVEEAPKLKETSHIHAEAGAAGELKHGPLALVDADIPVITVAPNNDML